MEFEPMLTPREKSPQPEDRTRDAVDSEPKHYQQAIPAPISVFKIFNIKCIILTCVVKLFTTYELINKIYMHSHASWETHQNK